MKKHESDNEEPLEDRTVALTLISKRTERLRRKREERRRRREHATLLALPAELKLEIFEYLRPSDALSFSCVNHQTLSWVNDNSRALGRHFVRTRYTVLQKCFPLPRLLSSIDTQKREILLRYANDVNPSGSIHKRYYLHVEPPDTELTCSCVACIMAWNNLNVILDFAFYRSNLERGIPIPQMPRGHNPPWNQDLTSRHAATVRKALENPLYYARILEIHLRSVVSSIKRQGNNNGNKRRHFVMTLEDEAGEVDDFLEREGPNALEFPYMRDLYYLLEAYLPNRSFKKDEKIWVYYPLNQHETDLHYLLRRYLQVRTASSPSRNDHNGDSALELGLDLLSIGPQQHKALDMEMTKYTGQPTSSPFQA